MITLDRKKVTQKWFDFDDDGVSFAIRPFPISQRALSPSGVNLIEVLIKQATYCLIEWKGIVDTDGAPIKCTEENKQFILDYSEDIVMFVIEKSKELNEEVISLASKKI